MFIDRADTGFRRVTPEAYQPRMLQFTREGVSVVYTVSDGATKKRVFLEYLGLNNNFRKCLLVKI